MIFPFLMLVVFSFSRRCFFTEKAPEVWFILARRALPYFLRPWLFAGVVHNSNITLVGVPVRTSFFEDTGVSVMLEAYIMPTVPVQIV